VKQSPSRPGNVIRRFRPWQLAIVVVALCVIAVGVARWWRASSHYDAARLISALPIERATTVLFLDSEQLRRGGLLALLAGSKAAEEPDYRKFVDETGFDYRVDLDAVAATFIDNRFYATLRGRFRWKQLTAYAESQGGECHYSVCTMPGSTVERNISFFPLKSDVLALAVSNDPRAVTSIGSGRKLPMPVPSEPFWISVPAATFNGLDTFPAGTRGFLSPLVKAERVIFAAGPQGDRLQLRLEVACATPEAAAEMVKQFSGVTDLLKSMLVREHMTPNPRDLSGVLVAGTFEQHQSTVIGTWPVERDFVEALASGQIQ
jgi:hypothetical protein